MPDDNGSAIRITNRELYDSLQRLKDEVHDAVRMFDVVQADVREHDKRLRGLELRFYGILAGVIGAVGILVSGTGGV